MSVNKASTDEVRAMIHRQRYKTQRDNLEGLLLRKITDAGLPAPEREYRFCGRRWRADFAWPGDLLLVEVDGGSHVYGRHNRPEGFERDLEKLNTATIMGWRVLRFTGRQVRSTYAIRTIREALSGGTKVADLPETLGSGSEEGTPP